MHRVVDRMDEFAISESANPADTQKGLNYLIAEPVSQSDAL